MLNENSLFDNFLQKLHKDKSYVHIFLINGIKLQGQLYDFDEKVVILKNKILQMVFRHAISTIVPGENVKNGVRY